MTKRTARKLEFFLHILTAFLLLLKGYSQIRLHLYFPGGILLFLAATVLVLILSWKPLGVKPKQARIACYYIESAALFITSYIFLLEGKDTHPYIFFLAAILYPVLGFISSKKFRQLRKPDREEV